MNNTFYTNVAVASGKILYRGYENGRRVREREAFSPSLFLPTRKPTEFRDIRGNPVEEVRFNTIPDAKKFVKSVKGSENIQVHGNDKWQYQYIASLYPNHEDATYDPSLIRTAFIDIETECERGFPSPDKATEKINVISITFNEKKWVLATGQFELPPSEHLTQICNMSEADLLMKFYDIMDEIDPDAISGWNCKFFDIPYIINRTRRVLDGIPNFEEFPDILSDMHASRFSPWRQIKPKEVEYRGRINNIYEIVGIAILDYYEMYRKYVLEPRENYKLDHIAEVELGRKKVDYSEYGSFREFYTQNFQKFVEYNLEDTLLVQDIDKKRNLINLHLMMAYMAKANYEDVFSQVRTWDCIIYNHLAKSKIVIPPKSEHDKIEKYEGAYVKIPVPGMRKWVVSFDAASLYPSLMRFNGISSDTLLDVPKIKFTIDDLLNKSADLSFAAEKNVSVTANGCQFTKQKTGFMAELMSTYFENRKKYKKLASTAKKQIETEKDESKLAALKMDASKYDTMQHALKIALNSCYGACGSPAFRYYDERLAEAITMTGQLVIKWVSQDINQYLHKLFKTTKDYTFYNDTDSVFVELDDLVKSVCDNVADTVKIVNFIDGFCNKQLNNVIAKSVENLRQYLNGYEGVITFNRDVIADRGVWKAKKMYCLNVHDAEGVRYAEPHLKIMGIESQRSSTPAICRRALKDCVKIILTGEEADLIKYVKAFKKKYMATNPLDLASPRGVNRMEYYSDPQTIYKKGTPIAVKGSLLYNHWLKANNLADRYVKIGSGDKIKFLPLIVPNPVREKVIAFPGIIAPEFNLEKYIDRHSQWEKTFEAPLEHLLKVIGWSSKEKNSLF